MMKRFTRLAVLGLALSGLAGGTPAMAATVFEGESNSQFGAGGFLYGQEWDIALSGKFFLQDGPAFSVEADQPFQLFKLGYWNILGLGDATANINTTVTLTSPGGMSPNPMELNIGADADDGGWFIVFFQDTITLTGQMIYSFNVNGVEGELEILGFKDGQDYTDTITVKGLAKEWEKVYAVFRFDDETGIGAPIAPLPAAAWGGIMLLGGLGAKRLRRRD